MFGQDEANQQQGAQSWQQPADPVAPAQPVSTDFAQDSNLETPAAQPTQAVVAPALTTAQPSWDAPANDSAPATSPEVPEAAASDDLMAIKQKALTELSPLVGHLDQTPEEKFKTTMMMIQASDNQALISEAYAAAQAITDDKAKAQALLDIVNEINYFTQPQN